MVNVIGVRFRNDGKLYFFDPGALWPTPGDYVIVETSRGLEFAETVTTLKEIDETTLDTPLRPVVHIATAEDIRRNEENHASEREAHRVCQKKIAEHKLDMKLVRVESTFDNSKILFYFTANGRVDFRALVKDLAGVFKTRIELRQIGVRDEAKMLGGLGPCGRQICCGAFLSDFQPVSIKMAKEQSLSLNPTKISGICGRLMCCLKYEQDQYEAVRKQMPKVGKEVMTPDGVGVVTDLNVIRETVRVRVRKGDGHEMRDYPMTDVQRLGQASRTPQPEETEALQEYAPVRNDDAPAANPDEQPAPRQRREKPHKQRRDDAAAERREKRGESRAKAEGANPDAQGGERPSRHKDKADEHTGRQNPVQETPAAEKPVTPAAAEPAKQPAPAPQKAEKPASAESTKPAQPEKPAPAQRPAASGWKAALAKAMADAVEKRDSEA
ncbi:MAG: hypothetical protein IJE07_00825 [Clostridia bacterium]|nr:hypothetical protein [Clostridia bacterium]